MKILETERLILRTWQPRDEDVYFTINQDPKVTAFLPGGLTREQVHTFIIRANHHYDVLGYTLWATELKKTGCLIGFIGLNNTDFSAPLGAHFSPAVEIAWRLDYAYWGKGYATEGAKAALSYGFENVGLQEIVAFTVPANTRSIRVMEKIGMSRDVEGDFVHPKLATTHPLSHHVLYRMLKDNFLRNLANTNKLFL